MVLEVGVFSGKIKAGWKQHEPVFAQHAQQS